MPKPKRGRPRKAVKYIPRHICLPHDLNRQIEAAAKREGRSFSDTARRLIQAGMTVRP